MYRKNLINYFFSLWKFSTKVFCFRFYSFCFFPFFYCLFFFLKGNLIYLSKKIFIKYYNKYFRKNKISESKIKLIEFKNIKISFKQKINKKIIKKNKKKSKIFLNNYIKNNNKKFLNVVNSNKNLLTIFIKPKT